MKARGAALVLVAVLTVAPAALAFPPLRLWHLQIHRASGGASGGVAPAVSGPIEVFPHVRLHRAARTVEFDGAVAVNAHAPDGSIVFLEVVVCRPDTKEHEALVVTDVLASHVHAALLLLGVEPGHPGGWEWTANTLSAIAAEGAALEVTIAWDDQSGQRHEHPATDLVVNRTDGGTLTEVLARDGPAPDPTGGAGDEGEAGSPIESSPVPLFVFAGSRFVQHEGREFYDADGTGLVVGLHTFGSETIALTRTMSHEASITEPEWIARADLLPRRGTAVVVRLRVVTTTGGEDEAREGR